MKTLLLSLSLIFAIPSYSAVSAPDFAITITKAKSNWAVSATPPKGHHINEEAPASVQIAGGKKIKPGSITKKEARFELSVSDLASSSSAEANTVSVFICDDANTFCEKKTVRFKIPGRDPSSVAWAGENSEFETDAKLALSRAAKEKRPLFIDFYGIWCPPCNMFNERVFNRPDFLRQTKNFVRLKLDADSEASWELKSKYKVGGYPTIVLATASGEEIYRLVGYRPADELYNELSTVQSWSENFQLGVSTLKKRAEAGDLKAKQFLGAFHLEHKQYAEASTLFEAVLAKDEKNAKVRRQLFQARVGASEGKPEKDQIAALESVLSSCGPFVECIEFRQQLAEKLEATPEKKNAEFEKVVEETRAFIANPKLLSQSGYSVADVWAMHADALESLGKTEDAKRAWTSAVKAIRGSQKKADERGSSLELGYALRKSGKVEEARTLYKRFERKYPKEFTFFFAHARLEMDQKNYKSAEPLAKQATDYSYGDNKLRAVETYAKVLRELNRKEDAIAMIKKALEEAPRPADTSIRTVRYIKSLEKLSESILIN